MKKTQQQAFTLIEIAIVIIIIGLLTGGVLKGLDLLEDARLQKTSDQIRSLQSAWFNYINRYRQIPGDDSQATVFLSADATNGDGGGTLSDTEKPNVWQHLHLAGIVQGSGTNAATTPWGNSYEFSYDSEKKQHLLCIEELSGSRAALLDLKKDDGVANSGSFFDLDMSDSVDRYNAANTYSFCVKL